MIQQIRKNFKQLREQHPRKVTNMMQSAGNQGFASDAQKKANAAQLRRSICAVAAEVVAQDPNWKHAQACLEHMKTEDSCT